MVRVAPRRATRGSSAPDQAHSAQADPAIIVCGLSALRGIRRARRVHDLWSWTPPDAQEQERVLAAATSRKSLIDFEELARHGFWGEEETEELELLVGRPADRRKVAHVRCRCASGPLPEGSLCRVASGLYATSPLYTAWQYSKGRGIAAVVMLLSELMGTYGLSEEATMTIAWGGVWPGKEEGPALAAPADATDPALVVLGDATDPDLAAPACATDPAFAVPACATDSDLPAPADQAHYRCDPAFTREDLDAFARVSSDRVFAQAAAIALPDAASPMESVMAGMLGAPHRLGGFGLSALRGGMLLNHRIDFDHDAVLMSSGMPYAICDAYIPAAKAEIEYNGIGHEEESARVHDGERNNGIRGMGIKVVVVNRGQMRDIRALEAIARSFHRAAGVRYRDVNDGQRVLQGTWLNSLRAAIGMDPV